MKKILFKVAALISFITLISCSLTARPMKNTTKLLADSRPKDMLVWVGKGESFQFKGGKWIRNKSQDYDFSVVQRRFADRWVSVKNILRRHPDYDMAAGKRTQTHLFEIFFKSDSSMIPFELKSTFGDGNGIIDSEFTNGSMDFKAEGVSSFAPFDHYNIIQTYLYDEKILKETVILYKKKDNGEKELFAKVEEVATLLK